jgi:hypothetical protein
MAAVLNGVLYTGSLGNPSTVSDTLMGEKEKARESLCIEASQVISKGWVVL